MNEQTQRSGISHLEFVSQKVLAREDAAWLLFNMDYNVQKMHEKSDNVQNVQDLNGL